MLKKTYFPEHEENRMKNEGDVAGAREFFFKHRPNNLDFLLRTRFDWMNEFIEGKTRVIEIGAGAGFTKEYINNPNLRLTDFNSPHPWIEENVDALHMPYEDGSLDIVISSHMIHHLATPYVYFEEIKRVLKPGGMLVIHDLETSLALRVLLRFMRHEGYSYEVDVFGKDVIANKAEDPWSANCAIPQLLFRDEDKFHQVFPELEIIKNDLCEVLVFPLSGGVISKTKTVNLPYGLLKFVNGIDHLLVKIFPSVFAMGRKVVIRKRGEE